jgi:filamentous hemagglutinin family protein
MLAINKLPFYGKLARILATGVTIFFAVQGHAEIATDGTLGRVSNLVGPDFRIGPELGVTVGKNLFHSFQRFNVNSSESATFTGPDTINNVISRVTGGSVSLIDGLLRSDVGTADFYFINPAGVVFGPTARVDVPAAFHVSTADEVRFPGGSVFNATTPAASSLTAEAPESFGYLGHRAASLVVNESQLSFTPGSTVSFSSGDVTVQGEETHAAIIAVPDGEIRISAVGDIPDNVPLTGELNSGRGAFRVSHALIETSGDGGGNLRIGAGKATLTHSILAADNNRTTRAPAPGKTGAVTIRISNLLEVLNGGRISSDTAGRGDGGIVTVTAENIRLDAQGTEFLTGFSSETHFGSIGKGGTITVKVSGLLEVLNGAQISSSTFATGDAGDVKIEAGRLTVLNGGLIASDTYEEGNAGRVEIEAGNLRIGGQGVFYHTGITSNANFISSGKAGTVTLRVAELLELLNSGQIATNTFGSGVAGVVKIEAGNVLIDTQGSSNFTGIASAAYQSSSGQSGIVMIRVADLIEVLNSGQISTDTNASGNAGEVNVEAGSLRIDGQGAYFFTGLTSRSGYGSSGKAGKITIRVADLLELLNGGQISNDTDTSGDAGGVVIEAGRLRIDGQGYGLYTGITSDASPGSSGKAGTMTIKVADLLELLDGGQISTNTYGAGDAQGMEIEAGSLRIDGQGSSKFTGIRSHAQSGSSGKAGTAMVRVANQIDVLNGGEISSSTFGSGNAGGVDIEAGSLRIDGLASNYFTGIGSTAEPSSSGNAGTVTITAADLLTVVNGGEISSSTFSSGNAGNVRIQAREIMIDSLGSDLLSLISSESVQSAQGFAGNVEIEAGKVTLQNEGAISISTRQNISEEITLETERAHLYIHSPLLILDRGAVITAQSWGNVPAAAIEIKADSILVCGNSRITTSSTDANGGPITLQGEVIDLRDSLITSSVAGLSGDGGNITIKGAGAAKALILEGGFIQANAPAGARGGDIFIDAKAVIPEGGVLEVGGLERQTFEPGSGRNIIQAAAPGGEQGTIQITSPELDISGSLVNLEARLAETIRLAADPCFSAGNAEANSLAFAGSGGLPAGPDQHAALFFDGDRLDRLLIPEENKQGPPVQ